MGKGLSKKLLCDFEAIFNATPNLYLILSPELEIVAVNEAYLKATMVKREQILGRNIFDVFPDNPGDPGATGVHNLSASLQRVLELKKPDAMAVQKYDVQHPREGGFEERYWSPLNSPVLGENKEILYIIHHVEDVTDYIRLKQSEKEQFMAAEELRSLAGRMEMEVYQRAQEIQSVNTHLRLINCELAGKEAALLNSNQELEAFSYTVSHDLKNSIHAIAGFATLAIKYGKLNAETGDFLKEITNTTQNMAELIDDLFEFSRTAQNEMRYEIVNLSEMVKKIVEFMKKQEPDRQIDFMIQLDVMANCDSHLIKIALQNLLQNAWKFTAKTKSPRIEFGMLDTEKQIYFIRDNGVGFSMENCNKLFHPFSRLHAEKDFKGTGIGLATVKRIIDRHQGQVWAESEPGKGTTFYWQF